MAEAEPFEPARAMTPGAKSLARPAKRSDAARMAPKTHWEERWIGVVRGYPTTPEAFDARKQRGRELFARLRAEGKALTRKGIPDGWAGRREDIKADEERARGEAAAAMKHLVERDCGLEAADGTAALLVALEIAMTRSIRGALRLKAAALVAEYTKAKPLKTVEVAVSPAEQFLALIGKL